MTEETEIDRLNAEIARLQAYQNQTALAWTKLTESQEREIDSLKAEVELWKSRYGVA